MGHLDSLPRPRNEQQVRQRQKMRARLRQLEREHDRVVDAIIASGELSIEEVEALVASGILVHRTV
jgi:hypothetical protein